MKIIQIITNEWTGKQEIKCKTLLGWVTTVIFINGTDQRVEVGIMGN